MPTMATIPMRMRADRAVLKRQQQEFQQETRMMQEVEQYKVGQKALFENKSSAVIRSNNVRDKALAMKRQHENNLQKRRALLADKLDEEQRALEQEMVDREETPQQRTEKMAVRAYELKKRREDERKAIVQEKLYQQWRSGLDDVRAMDSKIVQLQTIADRDNQLDEKAAKLEDEKAHDQFYDQLWHDGYMAKIERENLERQAFLERREQMVNVLGIQLNMKEQRVAEEKEQEMMEAEQMKKVWVAQEEAEKEVELRTKIFARQERAKADEYMAVQQAHREYEEQMEKDYDKAFINGVLERERKLAEKEDAERILAAKKTKEYTEALKIEMAKKAESEEQLIKLQQEESERQWQKRYEKWEKEELARRKLMEEVYEDRAQQLQHKEELRDQLKEDLAHEKAAIDAEMTKLEAAEAERQAAEQVIRKKQQEDLFRQMDYREVARQRKEHQKAIEQRQSAIAESKIRRAVEREAVASQKMMTEILDTRKANLATKKTTLAPWEK